MPSDYKQILDASRPDWYRLVLACLRGEIPLSEVPEERRHLCVQWRPSDRRRTPPGEAESVEPHNKGWRNIESGAHSIGRGRLVPLMTPGKARSGKPKSNFRDVTA